MTIIFMGTPDFAVPILKAVHKHYGVDLLITQPDQPTGRKRHPVSPPTKVYAESVKMPVLQPGRVNDISDFIHALNPDVIITAAYGQFLPNVVLNAPTKAAINVHASLLPALRGGAPIQRAIEYGHRNTGVTIMQMVKQMDAGPIYMQKPIPISPGETAGSLFTKLSEVGAELLLEALPKIVAGKLQPKRQDDTKATYAPVLKREEEKLDLTAAATTLERKIRAFHPEPNTYVLLDEKPFKIIEASVFKTDTDAEPGRIIAITGDGPVVKTGKDGLLLTRVQLPGKKAMDAKQFMHGAGQKRITLSTQLK